MADKARPGEGKKTAAEKLRDAFARLTPEQERMVARAIQTMLRAREGDAKGDGGGQSTTNP